MESLGKQSYGAGGSGIGILLQSQTGIKLHYTAKLALSATNNIAEYEAVIMALKIIVKIGTQKFIIFSDSHLVVNQYQEKFKFWEPNLVKYEEKVPSLMARIKHRQGNCELY